MQLNTILIKPTRTTIKSILDRGYHLEVDDNYIAYKDSTCVYPYRYGRPYVNTIQMNSSWYAKKYKVIKLPSFKLSFKEILQCN